MALRLPGWWQDLTSPEFAGLDPEATVAVLPVGAIEQHGPHLPVAVDTCIVDGIVRAVLALLPAGAPVLDPADHRGRQEQRAHRFPRHAHPLSRDAHPRLV